MADQVQDFNRQGTELFQKANFKGAIKFFDRILDINRYDRRAWINRANCFLRLNKLQQAVNCLDRAVDIDPFYANGWYSKGLVEQKHKKLNKMGESLGMFLACSDKNADSRVTQAEEILKHLVNKGFKYNAKAFEMTFDGYRLASDQKDFQGSVDLLTKAAAISPGISKLWQYRAMAQDVLGQIPEAVKSYTTAIKSDTYNATYWFNKGMLLRRMERYEDAIRCYENAVKIFPDYLEALSNLGNALGIIKRNKEALEYLKKAVIVSPSAENPWFNKALTEDDLGLFEEAKKSYERFLEVASSTNQQQIEISKKRIAEISGAVQQTAIDLNGWDGLKKVFEQDSPQVEPSRDHEQAVLWNSKGAEMFEQNLINEAIACFDKAIEFDSQYYEPLFNKGTILSDLNRFEEAVACYHKAIRINPDIFQIWLNLSADLLTLGRAEEALSAADKAVQLGPQEILTWYNRGMAYSKLGRYEEALKDYEKGLQINPRDLNCLNNKGTSFLRLKRFQDADACFEIILSLNPHYEYAWYNKGYALNHLSQYDMAVSCFDKALKIREFASAWCGKGESLRYLKRYEEAIAAYDKALSIHNTYSDAYYGKSQCEEALGMGKAMLESMIAYVAYASDEYAGFDEYWDMFDAVKQKIGELGISEEALQEQIKKLAVKAPENRSRVGHGDNFLGQKYEVIQTLGKGGFGVVYHVYSHDTDAVYALKTFRDEYMADNATREMFKKEAQVLVDMDSHPYLVEDYFVDDVAGRLFIAMEYIPPDDQGINTLQSYLDRKEVDTALALKWSIQFCHGMEFALSQGLRCHRDIKPENIMITQQRTIKISDFGLAGIVSGIPVAPDMETDVMASFQDQGIGMTKKGKSFGTPTHMPPEQYKDAATCDERSDIYSFGIVMFQMAAGKLPFMAAYPRSNTQEEFQRFWRDMHELHFLAPVPDVDSLLNPVIKKCLAKEPVNRFQSFSELRMTLEPMLKELSGEVERPPEKAETNAGEWLNKGLSLKNLGHMEAAISCYDKSIELSTHKPTLSQAWSNKGNCYNSTGDMERAMECYDKALKLDTRNEKAWCNKGLALQNQGKFEQALECYDKALEIEPKLAIAWNNKSFTYQTMGDLEKSILCADTAIKYDKGLEAAWVNKGVAFYANNHYMEAINCYIKALEIDPYQVVACFNLGLCFYDQKNYEKAIEYYDMAIKIQPGYIKAWSNKANALLGLKKFKEALECLDQALRIDPNYSTAWYFKSFVMMNLKDVMGTIKCLEAFLSINQPGTNQSYVEDAMARLHAIKGA